MRFQARNKTHYVKNPKEILAISSQKWHQRTPDKIETFNLPDFEINQDLLGKNKTGNKMDQNLKKPL